MGWDGLGVGSVVAAVFSGTVFEDGLGGGCWFAWMREGELMIGWTC